MTKTSAPSNVPNFDTPKGWVRTPPKGETSLHSCMGLNDCKGQDRYGANPPPGVSENDCAGKGYCATAAMHSCHTNNNCAGQGGCGLYGDKDDLANPGQNGCRSMGSCAVPINAERFITDGEYRGQSVWERAREVFEANYTGTNPLGQPPENFPNGPSAWWIKNNGNCNSFAACGSSGMSGGGSCG